MKEDAIAGVRALVKNAPTMVVLFLVVAVFLYYLDRREHRDQADRERDDLVAIQRIEQCHAVQERTVDVIEKLEQVLEEQQLTLERLRIAIESRGGM